MVRVRPLWSVDPRCFWGTSGDIPHKMSFWGHQGLTLCLNRIEPARAVLALEVLEGQLASMSEDNRPVPALNVQGGRICWG